MARYDHYASSVFGTVYGPDGEPQIMLPELPPPGEGSEGETIDYWSVEAFRQGWHGRAGVADAERVIKSGLCVKGTKNTKMPGWG